MFLYAKRGLGWQWIILKMKDAAIKRMARYFRRRTICSRFIMHSNEMIKNELKSVSKLDTFFAKRRIQSNYGVFGMVRCCWWNIFIHCLCAGKMITSVVLYGNRCQRCSTTYFYPPPRIFGPNDPASVWSIVSTLDTAPLPTREPQPTLCPRTNPTVRRNPATIVTSCRY